VDRNESLAYQQASISSRCSFEEMFINYTSKKMFLRSTPKRVFYLLS